jgi:acyl carrier protein
MKMGIPEEKIISIIEMQFDNDPGDITRSTRFREDLNADDLDAVELAMECEDKFGIMVTDEEYDLYAVKTVGEFVDIIKNKEPQ